MIFHVLRFSFDPGVSESDREDLLSRLRKTQNVSLCVVGQDLGDGSEGYTHTCCVSWEHADQIDPYLADPVHREDVALFVERVGKFTAVDFSDDMDPTLGARIAEMHKRHQPDDPAFAERIRQITD